MSIQATELWHNKRESWISNADLVKQKDQLVIQSQYSLVSTGTERLVISNSLNGDASLKMKVPYMQGSFEANFTYGYSLVGRIINGPTQLMQKAVHVMHPHQDIVQVSADDITILPEDLSPEVCTLASNMETAVNAIWDSEISLGDKVLVIGYGIIGALLAKLAQRITCIDITVLETNPDKHQGIFAAGHQLHNGEMTNDFDIVFNASANANALQMAFEITRLEGKIIEMSWFGNQPVTLNLGSHFHYGRKQLISSQVSHIPNKKTANWDYQKRKSLVFDLLRLLNPKELIEKEIPFHQTPDFYNNLRNQQRNEIGIIIKY